MRALAKFLVNVVVYAAIVAGIVFGLPRYLAWQFGTPYPIAAITSGSMWPDLKRGDIVFIRKVPREDIGVGDVVVWKNEKGFTIHRVVQLNEETLVTKGDANFTEDPPVRYEDVVGETVSFRGKPLRIPYFGFISVMRARN